LIVHPIRASLAIFLSATLLAIPAFATRVHRTAATGHAHGARKLSSKSHKPILAAKSHKLHGQQSIEPARVTEIQQALIRENYLHGEANGSWDSTTTAAMQKYQADQGWQTKIMPDSRALKKLGLGPDYSTAINATKDSSFGAPVPMNSISPSQSTAYAAASGAHQ
jgi:peptidoglycan hydrolase-like protein with peptidoglycan-binding domain